MFDNLVESSSNKDDIARKGSFIGITMVIYGVVLMAFVVGSIYMVDAQMESQTQELETMVAPIPVPDPPKPEEKVQPKEQTKDTTQDTRTELQARMDQNVPPPKISTVSNNVPPATVRSKLGDTNNAPPPPTGPIGPTTTGGGGTGPVVPDDDAPPPPPKKEPPPKTIVSGGVLNGKAINLVHPSYPPVAKAAHASGQVVVQITIGEDGGVISAVAVSGHPLLRAAAVQAARSTRFTPTKLSGVPVKVTGSIIYNFTAQ